MFGMLVLVVDVGGLLWKRRELVNGADAAALAAAQTCSLPLAQDGSLPEDQADRAAIANVQALTTGAGGIIDGQLTCRQPRGFVTVQYQQDKDLFFAPVLGFGDTNPVTTQATAAWGPLGGGQAVPIVLESSQFQGPCDIPDNVNIGDECSFWYNNGTFAIGGADWGFLNLDEWDVAKDANCSASGASNRSEYIRYNFETPLILRNPGPTYVCADTGHASSNWQDLLDRMNCDPNSSTPSYGDCPGNIMLMPVNDCAQQVDKSGNIVPCGSGTPDKFAIIGFTQLALTGVYRGNDPAAIGSPGTAAQTGNCGGGGANFPTSPTNQWNLGSFADNNCGGPDYLSNAALYHVPFSSVSVTRKVGSVTTTFFKCTPTQISALCDYRYNEDNASTVGGIAPLTLQWVNPLTAGLTNKMINLNWNVDGTPPTLGYCGLHASDPNAVCIVTTWQGYSTRGSVIGEGPDEGTRGFILCDFQYDSCPAGVKP
jgi:hypothetical protein